MAVAADDILCNGFKKRRGNFLQTGQWTDCKFLVGAEPTHEYIEGHKIMLAMASPVFEVMLYGTMAEPNEIRIPDIQPETFRTLLSYIYTQEIKIKSFDDACDLLYGAKKYMLHYLTDNCVKYLLAALCPRNACKGYEFGKLFEIQILMDECLQIMCTMTNEVLKDVSFEKIEIDTLLTIFEQDRLSIVSEADLFVAAGRYFKDRKYDPVNSQTQMLPLRAPAIQSAASDASSKSEIEPSTTDLAPINEKVITLTCPNKSEYGSDTSQTSAPQPIAKALKKIRFLTLTPQQFAQSVKECPLLSDVEVNAIFMNISLPFCEVSMPDGFSTSINWRTMQ